MPATLAALATALVLPTAPAAAAPATFSTGFTDPLAFERAEADRRVNLEHAKQAGARLVRVFAFWDSISPTAPPTTADAKDPRWSGYRFSSIEAKVRTIAAAGLTPVVVINKAPRWAEGGGRPPVSDAVPAGTWRPSLKALASFSRALSRRFDGTVADPLVPGAKLPSIRYWQVWNEPNLYTGLTPQWRTDGGRRRMASASWYRAMLRPTYAALKATSAANVVVSAGLGPFGDLGGRPRRTPPAAWTRDFVCVRGRSAPRATRCPGGAATFDVFAHHPYPIGPPSRHAPNPDDVCVPDLRRLTRPLRAAERAGNVLPRGRRPVWATEISWDSSPDPDGLSLATQARYLTGAFHVLWQQGVSAVLWFNLRDEPEGAGWGQTLQSGIFARADDPANDVPKPALTAFRFPFIAYLTPGSGGRLWGKAPNAGPVTIQRLRAGAWRSVATTPTGLGRIFQSRLDVGVGTRLRAVQSDERSLTWEVLR